MPASTVTFNCNSLGDTTNLSVAFNGEYLLFPLNTTLTDLDPTVKLFKLSEVLPSTTVTLCSTPLIKTLKLILRCFFYITWQCDVNDFELIIFNVSHINDNRIIGNF